MAVLSPQPPQVIYNSLIQAGASTNQAIGIMANAINESGFDPEAVGDQGTSFGIVQEHGSQYSRLVTGNIGADLRSQIALLVQQGAFLVAGGKTPQEAAGNFAANYEKCVGCQPGGQQYNQRVANANTVAGWASSGKWPTSAGSAQTTGILNAGPLPGGWLNPFNWPVIGASQGLKSVLGGLGLSDLRDLAVRGGLIILGALMILVGIVVLAGRGAATTALTVAAPESRAAGVATGAGQREARRRTEAATRRRAKAGTETE